MKTVTTVLVIWMLTVLLLYIYARKHLMFLISMFHIISIEYIQISFRMGACMKRNMHIIGMRG